MPKVSETITGFVVPEAWDDQFCVCEVLIACDGERDIRVVNLDSHPILFDLVGKQASVTGVVRHSGSREEILVQRVKAH
ncbi:hypothetical protein [Salidesulfovibrio onnuriiensis]|uniref:hypothetical protein n=1 Tax=Salidesulfovibrio onnuriiensis TaxID=2583823 RepID=UPI0011CA73E5|nr:hypothetical protein [Salidesulfovibrio onnuriiensis]